MSEPWLGSESLHAGAPFSVGACRLLLIERRLRLQGGSGGRRWLSYERRPHALLLRDAGGLRAIGADGRGLPLAPLREQLPELDHLLDAR